MSVWSPNESHLSVIAYSYYKRLFHLSIASNNPHPYKCVLWLKCIKHVMHINLYQKCLAECFCVHVWRFCMYCITWPMIHRPLWTVAIVSNSWWQRQKPKKKRTNNIWIDFWLCWRNLLLFVIDKYSSFW